LERNHDQPEQCVRSIWTDPRRAHRAEPDEPPADNQDPAPSPAASGPSGLASWGGLGTWWSLAAATAAGLTLAAAFPPVGIWPLAIAGPAYARGVGQADVARVRPRARLRRDVLRRAAVLARQRRLVRVGRAGRD